MFSRQLTAGCLTKCCQETRGGTVTRELVMASTPGKSFGCAILLSCLLTFCVVTAKAGLPSQALIRDNSSEPESVDPQKIIGQPGKDIATDLFEGW